MQEFQNRLAACGSHGHSGADVCSACRPLLERAVSLYQDDFMAGFTLRDSPAFDDWQFFQAEGLRRELASALERLSELDSNASQHGTAIAHARRRLALDTLHEPAHRWLMRLYAWSGDRTAALRQYRECVRVLERDLGVPPLEETNQLYEAIKEDRLAPPQGASAASVAETTEPDSVGPFAARPIPQVPPGEPGPPLVGRSEEWEAILGLHESVDEDGRLLVIEGEAGIGKTRLAETFLEHVRSKGLSALSARCYEGEAGLAFGPFVECLKGALRPPNDRSWTEGAPGEWLSEASRLAPEFGRLRADLPPPAALDGPGAQTRFFEAVSAVVAAACGPRGVLFLDDVHWSDEASIDLLLYLVRRLQGRSLCVVVTWRTEALPSDHRMRGALSDGLRSGTARVVGLERLTQSDVSQLIASRLPKAVGVDDALDRRLFEETEGLPFFVVEYLAAMSRDRSSGEDDLPELPAGAGGLLRSRLSVASELGRQLLTAAAVIGSSFDFETLQEASGRNDDETVAALEDLVSQGLVLERRSGEGGGAAVYDFGHDKLREYVYEEASLARRRLLHRRTAEAMAGRSISRPEAGSRAGAIANHYQLGGREPEAAQYFKAAGEYARGLYANAEAMAHFQSALALGHSDGPGLHEALGDLQTLSGEYAGALMSYETAAALSKTAGVATLEHKLGGVRQRRGEWELAESHFKSALAALVEEGAPSVRARVHADWSLTAHSVGDSKRAKDLARKALHLAKEPEDVRALAQAHNILGVLAKSEDDFPQARLELERSLALADRLGAPEARVAAMNNLALVYGGLGEVDKAIELGDKALKLCATLGDRHREAAIHNNLSDLLHDAGRSPEAMSHLEAAVTLFAEVGAEEGRLQPEIWKLVEW